jgi:hypothetical protein
MIHQVAHDREHESHEEEEAEQEEYLARGFDADTAPTGVGGVSATGVPILATTPGADAAEQGGTVDGYNDGMCNV